MPPAPNLKDPAERAAYRQELRGIGVGLRRTGVLFAVIGAGVLLVRRFAVPDMPVWIPVAVLALAFFTIATAITTRTRYHQLRMRGDD